MRCIKYVFVSVGLGIAIAWAALFLTLVMGH